MATGTSADVVISFFRAKAFTRTRPFAVNSTGLLATNAHVADPVKKLLKRSGSVFVVAQGGKKRYRVYEAGCHRGYDPNSMFGNVADVG